LFSENIAHVSAIVAVVVCGRGVDLTLMLLRVQQKTALRPSLVCDETPQLLR